MLTDIWTVARKELKEIVAAGGGGGRGRWSFVIFLVMFGIFLPLQGGVQGVESGQSIVFFAWVPFLLITNVIADSFAGERERHTLETLLATRLSDRAILLGKMFSAILYGLGLTLASLVLSIAAVNLVFRPDHFVIYPLGLMVGMIVVALLGSVLASGVGVLVSLRASTTRQAQQTMGLAIIVLFLPFYAIPFLPRSAVEKAVMFIMNTPIPLLVGGVLLFFIVLDVVVVSAALARFKRSRLILD